MRTRLIVFNVVAITLVVLLGAFLLVMGFGADDPMPKEEVWALLVIIGAPLALVLLCLVPALYYVRKLPGRRPAPRWFRPAALVAVALSAATMGVLELFMHKDLEDRHRQVLELEEKIEEHAELNRQIKAFKADQRLLEEEIRVNNHAVESRWIPWRILDLPSSIDVTLEALHLDQGSLLAQGSASREGIDALFLALDGVDGIADVELHDAASRPGTAPRFLLKAELPYPGSFTAEDEE